MKVKERKLREESIRKVKPVRRFRGTYQEPMSQEPVCRGQVSQESVPRGKKKKKMPWKRNLLHFF